MKRNLTTLPKSPSLEAGHRAQSDSDSDHKAFQYKSLQPFNATRIQAAAVYCSDGRWGAQVDDLLHNALKLPRYDRLSIPGGAACLAGHLATYFEEDCVVKQLRFLVEAHQLRRVVLVAHQDCAYYAERLHVPLEKLAAKQREDLLKAIQRVKRIDAELSVKAFFARKSEQMYVASRDARNDEARNTQSVQVEATVQAIEFEEVS